MLVKESGDKREMAQQAELGRLFNHWERCDQIKDRHLGRGGDVKASEVFWGSIRFFPICEH